MFGLVVFSATNFPPFQPFAMLGGFAWALGKFEICNQFTLFSFPYYVNSLGNLPAIPIIKQLGVGTAQLIWGVANCFVGWAISRFGITIFIFYHKIRQQMFLGLFGMVAHEPSSPLLNYLGVVIVIIGYII